MAIIILRRIMGGIVKGKKYSNKVIDIISSSENMLE